MEESLASTTATPQQTMTHNTEMPKKKKGGKGKFIACGCLLLILLILLALAAGLLVASQSNSNIPVLSDVVEQIEHIAKPDKVVAQEVTNNIANDLLSMKTAQANGAPSPVTFPEMFKYSFNMNASGTPAGGTKETADLTGSGAADIKKGDVKLSMNLGATATVQGTTLSPTLDLRVFGNTTSPLVYFRANNIPTTLLGSFPDINNKWVKFDVKKTMDSLNALGGSATVTPKTTTDTSAEIDKLAQFIKSDVIVNNFKRTPDQVLNGVRANCFAINMGPTQVQDLYTELKTLYPEQYTTMSADTSLKTLDLTGCVGRKDNLPYKLAIDTTSNTKEAGDTVLHMEMNFKDYNVPVTIDEPAPDMTFEELMQSLLQSYMGTSSLGSGSQSSSTDLGVSSVQQSARETERRSALLDIETALFTYYSNSGTYPSAITLNSGGNMVVGDQVVNLSGSALAKSGKTDSTGTAYCYKLDADGSFELGYQSENGSWGDAGSSQQVGTSSLACTENTLL